jgi:hypothetical protein
MSPVISWIVVMSLGWAIYAWMKNLEIQSLRDELERNKPPF